MVRDTLKWHEKDYLVRKFEQLVRTYTELSNETVLNQRLVSINELCVKAGSNWHMFLYYSRDVNDAWNYYRSGQYTKEWGNPESLAEKFRNSFFFKPNK